MTLIAINVLLDPDVAKLLVRKLVGALDETVNGHQLTTPLQTDRQHIAAEQV